VRREAVCSGDMRGGGDCDARSDLARNRIGLGGVEALTHGGQLGNKLRVLSLSDNALVGGAHAAAAALGRAIAASQLRVLRIARCGFVRSRFLPSAPAPYNIAPGREGGGV
jgi:hypothetical protein